MPEVSVIINCFNEASFLRETLDSVFEQSFQDWEVVFWNNGSTDGSGEIAASYGDRVRCFQSDPTVPLGRARKLAYEQTRGDYVAILDADDIWLPQKLERQLELFRSDPQVGMTYCDATYFDDAGDHSRLFQLTKPHRGRIFGRLLARSFIFSSTMMFRRKSLDQLGCAFDDKFSRAQDYDLTLRMAYHFPIDFVDEPLTKWRINGLADKPYKRSLNSREIEIRMALDNLINAYPQIRTEYSKELNQFDKSVEYSLAVGAWENGDHREARRHLSRHLRDKKFAFVYLCSLVMTARFFYRFRTMFRK